MKVYQINVTARFSTGTIAKSIHNALIARGDQGRFAYGFGGTREKDFYQIADLWSLRLDAKWMQMTGREGFFQKRNTQRLIQDIRLYNPDLIHLHNIHGNYVDWKQLISELATYGKPVIFTLHDCWMFTGGCYHFTQNDCQKWKSLCKDCAYQKKYVLKHLLPSEKSEYLTKKKLYDSLPTAYITTVSNWLTSVAKQSMLKNRTIYTVPNGVDTDLFGKRNIDELRHQLHCNGKYVLLGVASTWGNRKGLDKWVELSYCLKPEYQIVLVGLNRTQINNLPKNIIGLPRVSNNEELVKLYNLADVYINLSQEETFGLPTVEALACGTPVIVLNATANPELVIEEVGRVVENGSAELVLKAVEEVLKIGKDNMSEACICHARGCYSIQVMCEKYLHVYDEILGRIEKNGTAV